MKILLFSLALLGVTLIDVVLADKCDECMDDKCRFRWCSFKREASTKIVEKREVQPYIESDTRVDSSSSKKRETGEMIDRARRMINAEKLSPLMTELLGPNGGRRMLKAAWNNKYLFGKHDPVSDSVFSRTKDVFMAYEFAPFMSKRPPSTYKHWTIEPRGDKEVSYNEVVLKSIDGYFAREYDNYIFIGLGWLVDLVKNADAWEMWTPVKNDDGTWSFRSRAGRWLSAHREDDWVETMPENKGCEKFWLESW